MSARWPVPQKYGDGYVGALPPLELETLRGFKAGKVDVQGSFNFRGGAWVPWYTQHKVLMGLKDAWTLAGNAQAKEVTLRLADWVEELTRGLPSEQLQQMLRVEHGGMSETLADIYALTGGKISSAGAVPPRGIMRLLAGRDDCRQRSNTQIPKVVGEARSTKSRATRAADGSRVLLGAVVGRHIRLAATASTITWGSRQVSERLGQATPNRATPTTAPAHAPLFACGPRRHFDSTSAPSTTTLGSQAAARDVRLRPEPGGLPLSK